MAEEAQPHVDGRFSIRISRAGHSYEPSQQRAAHALRLEVLDEIGEDKGPAGAVKEVDLRQDAPSRDALVEGVLPCVRGVVIERLVEDQTGFGPACKSGGPIGASLRKAIPPDG